MHSNETGPFHVGSKAYQLTISDHILDNVYGQIGITPVERALERLPIFKRLHHISQLGLVNWIFPCALHTRYIHSVGVMHVAGEMALHINKNYKGSRQPFFDDSDIQIIRLAGLLHDIGHYPMSHNIEEAYKIASDSSHQKEISLKTPLQRLEEITKYPSSIMEPKNNTLETEEQIKNAKLKTEEKFFAAYMGSTGYHHENMGSLIICGNASIQEAVLKNFILIEENGELVLNPKFAGGKSEVSLDEVKSITEELLKAIGAMVRGDYDFDARARGSMEWLDTYSAMIQLIHSELDADNLDYLLRDATFSGTSYGIMDMSVLLNCLTVTELQNIVENKGSVKNFNVGEVEVTKRPAKQYIVGVIPKGVGCVDQFLLNKYLAYTQMILSKYVTILEEMLLRFEIDYVIQEELTNRSNYSCNGLSKLVAGQDPSTPYYWFSDHYILQKIYSYQAQARAFSKLPKAIISKLGNLSAFDLQKDDDVSRECICSGCTDEYIRTSISQSLVYKGFADCRKKWQEVETSCDKLSQADRDAEELELFSYHFTVYSLTKQVPKGDFLKQLPFSNMSPERRFAAHYYRLANGIPIIDSKQKYYYGSTSGESEELNEDIAQTYDLPDLCVDSPQSCLREMYSLRHVTLRQYKIE